MLQSGQLGNFSWVEAQSTSKLPTTSHVDSEFMPLWPTEVLKSQSFVIYLISMICS